MKKLLTNLLIFSIVYPAYADGDLPSVAGTDELSVNINYTPANSFGDVPYGSYGYGINMGGGAFDFAGYGSTLPGQPLNGGFGMNTAPVAVQDSSCPFQSQSEDVRAIWDNTKQILETLSQEQESGQCGLVRASSANLQQALSRLEGQKFRNLSGSSSILQNTRAQLAGMIEPNCQNYEDLFFNEYEQMINLVAGNYRMGSMPPDYHQECVQHYPLDEANFVYSAEFTNCLGDVLAQKIELAHNNCKGQSRYLDNIENQRAVFQAKKESLVQLQGAMNQLAQNIHNCDDKGIAQSAMRSLINVGSIIASPLTGGSSGVAVAFGGNILDSIIGFLFSKDSKSDLAAMNAEDDYNQKACLFYNAQRLRCNANYTMLGAAIAQNTVSTCQTKHEVNALDREVIDWLKGLNNITFNLQGGKRAKALIDFFRSNEKTLAGVPTIDFLNNQLKQKLIEEGGFQELAELNKFVRNFEELERIIQGISAGEIDPGAMTESLTEPSNSIPYFEKIRELETSLVSNNIVSSSIQNFAAAGAGTKDSFFDALKYSKSVEAYQKYIIEMQNNVQNQWNNTRTLDMSITVMVNNLKDKFEDRLADHFLADTKSAKAILDAGSSREDANQLYSRRASAFNQLSGIINDCLYTEGMHRMQEADLNDGARSTTNLKSSDKYEKYCKHFKCLQNSFASEVNKNDPEAFRSLQCSNFYAADSLIAMMRQNFMQTGRICNKTIDEIYKSRRR